MSLGFSSYCTIKNGRAAINGSNFFVDENELEATQFLSALYKYLQLDYRKFFKMDRLSKLGFLASELLLKDSANRDEAKEGTAIILYNSSASLDADTTYQTTIETAENYFPSPSDFVYTLPNIVTGEIAIRNKIYGETSFYVREKFNAQELHNRVSAAFLGGDVQQVLCGWVEYLQGKYEAAMFLVERKNDKNFTFEINTINQIYNQ